MLLKDLFKVSCHPEWGREEGKDKQVSKQLKNLCWNWKCTQILPQFFAQDVN